VAVQGSVGRDGWCRTLALTYLLSCCLGGGAARVMLGIAPEPPLRREGRLLRSSFALLPSRAGDGSGYAMARHRTELSLVLLCRTPRLSRSAAVYLHGGYAEVSFLLASRAQGALYTVRIGSSHGSASPHGSGSWHMGTKTTRSPSVFFFLIAQDWVLRTLCHRPRY